MKKTLLIALFYVPIALAESVNYFSPDDGQLTIVDNAQEVRVIVDQNGSQGLEITPSNTGKTFVYGNELTVIESTPLGIISY